MSTELLSDDLRNWLYSGCNYYDFTDDVDDEPITSIEPSSHSNSDNDAPKAKKAYKIVMELVTRKKKMERIKVFNLDLFLTVK